MRRFAFAIAAACTLVVHADGTPTSHAAPAPQSQTQQRLVAIGDLHADLDNAKRAFRLAGAIDERDVWIGGNLVVVQMGDVVGRGPEDRPVLDFVLDVQARAKAAGGTVHILLGNHEVFAARPDHRWVDPNAFAAFRGIAGLNLSHPRISIVPDAERHRAAALMPAGPYSRQIATWPAVLRVGNTVFAHGGVLPLWARYGIDRLNGDVRDWLSGRRADEPLATLGVDDGSLDDGVMWSRLFASDLNDAGCALLGESLSTLGATRMVVAHTVHKAITARCNERVWAIDVGISRYYGGSVQVLEIIGDRDVRAIAGR